MGCGCAEPRYDDRFAGVLLPWHLSFAVRLTEALSSSRRLQSGSACEHGTPTSGVSGSRAHHVVPQLSSVCADTADTSALQAEAFGVANSTGSGNGSSGNNISGNTSGSGSGMSSRM